MSRIADLPRREWRDGVEDLQSTLTEALKTRQGTFTLNPIQAAILFDFSHCPGCWGSASVGSGKSLIAALAKNVSFATRVLICLPASLERSLLNEFNKMRQHFKISDQFQVRSYSWLGREQNADYIAEYAPQIIICDEVHKLKRKDQSAVGRRFQRFFASPKGGDCKLLALSGSMMRKGFRDFSHILYWCLRDQAPVPSTEAQREAWACILDDSSSQGLVGFSAAIGVVCTTPEQARRAFQDRLRQTPGVVISDDSYEDVELSIRPLEVEPPECTNEDFQVLREEWTLPDDWDLADAKFEVWAKSIEMALGFYYQCDPRPPEPWADARKKWNRFCRKVIETSDCYDSMAQIVSACETGDLDIEPWQEWQAIRDTFKPSSKPVWLSDHALEAAIEWGQSRAGKNGRGGIVWVDHTAFGDELSKRTGWSYFGKKGYDMQRRHIEDVEVKDKVVIVSRWACSEGMNLQYKWCANLVTTPCTASLDWEQMLARTHRQGQKHKVTCDYFVACTEHLNAVSKTLWRGSQTDELLGQPVKVLRWKFETPIKRVRTHWAFKHTSGDE